jgi:hypothetical protein
MSARGPKSENRNRRMARRPRPRISADSAKGEPTKPSKAGFVGFVGTPYAGYAIIRTQPRGPGRSPLRRPHRPPGDGAQPIQLGLDCSTKTKRLMSWPERKTAAPEWRGGVAPAKAEA